MQANSKEDDMASSINRIDLALDEPNIDWGKVRVQGIRVVFIKAPCRVC